MLSTQAETSYYWLDTSQVLAWNYYF